MLIQHEREKLIEAVKFFAQNTKKLGKTKLFKLLYFLDFTHFRDTGRPVTGLKYFAWPMGPVPTKLFEELERPSTDWEGNCLFKLVATQKGNMLTVNTLSKFDPAHFSKRELRILQELAVQFKDADAEQMVEQTHLENLPWHQVYEVQGRRQEHIPYAMAVRKQEEEALLTLINDRAEMIGALRK
ncbi:DUF4065 domain-containing protein [Pseudomonas sp. MS19]|nr:DUF4065 domain-containing protein [Pseudomonas sp. MS19]